MMLPGTQQGTSVRPNPGADYPFVEFFGGKLRRYRTGEDSGDDIGCQKGQRQQLSHIPCRRPCHSKTARGRVGRSLIIGG